VTEFPLPVPDSRPYTIVTGADGALWFTESSRGVIGRITREGYLKEFRLPNPGSGPYGITVGRRRQPLVHRALRRPDREMTPSGHVTEYGGLTENSQPWDITPMRDGSLWFTEENVDQVGVIYPSGAVYEFPVGMGNLPTFITTGPGGNVWFTEELGNKIVRLTPGLTGITPKMVEYPLLTDGALPWDINPGPDGNIWFTELAGRNIGKIAPNGTITEYPVPGEYGMAGIFAGPERRPHVVHGERQRPGRIDQAGRHGGSGALPNEPVSLRDHRWPGREHVVLRRLRQRDRPPEPEPGARAAQRLLSGGTRRRWPVSRRRRSRAVCEHSQRTGCPASGRAREQACRTS
jgi:streptogramin lyase